MNEGNWALWASLAALCCVGIGWVLVLKICRNIQQVYNPQDAELYRASQQECPETQIDEWA